MRLKGRMAVDYVQLRDLGGVCPSDAPPDCIGGPTFSANGRFHHCLLF